MEKFSQIILHKDTPDQITTFIRQHKGQAGIQHLGFSCFADIKDAVRRTKLDGAQYLAPMSQYYLRVSFSCNDSNFYYAEMI